MTRGKQQNNKNNNGKKLYLLMALALYVAIAQAQEKLVALSFDDGPNTTTTVHMLDVLKKHQVKASFFVIGKTSPRRVPR